MVLHPRNTDRSVHRRPGQILGVCLGLLLTVVLVSAAMPASRLSVRSTAAARLHAGITHRVSTGSPNPLNVAQPAAAPRPLVTAHRPATAKQRIASKRHRTAAKKPVRHLATYRVRYGDSLSGIAHKLGHGLTWQRLCGMNIPPLRNCDSIYPGQVLRLRGPVHRLPRLQAPRPGTRTRTVLIAAHDWSGVANCESTNRWNINSGNGFYGGLQFTYSTWLAYGGGAFAPRADLATKAQQIAIAERVLKGQGAGAWPVCGRYLRSGFRTIVVHHVLSANHAPTNGARRAVSFALAQLGKPYVFGAAGPYSYDCSGLVMSAWRSAGVTRLTHTAAAQYYQTRHIDRSQLRPGDLIFVSEGSTIGHVGMYLGNQKVIEAPQPGDVVKIVPFDAYWFTGLYGRV